MALTRERNLASIKDRMLHLQRSIDADKVMQHQSAFTELENFFRDLLNLVFEWNLSNANRLFGRHQDSFDLVDERNRIVVQVTVTTTPDKIRKTLSSFIGRHDTKYRRLVFVYPTMLVKPTRADFSAQLQGFSFDSRSDRLCFGDVLQWAQDQNIDDQQRLVEFLEKEIQLPIDDRTNETRTPRPPSEATLKKLFALSGNECAFPGCEQPLVNEQGDLIAEVLYIRAVGREGLRYSDEQTDSDRRGFDNLVVLCLGHNAVVGNVSEFPVEKLHEMKRAHEARFQAQPYRLSSSQWERLRMEAENPQWVEFLNHTTSGLPLSRELREFLAGLPLHRALHFKEPSRTITELSLRQVDLLFSDYRGFAADEMLEDDSKLGENVFATGIYVGSWIANCINEDSAHHARVEHELIKVFEKVLTERGFTWSNPSELTLAALGRAMRTEDVDAYQKLLLEFVSAVT